MSQNDPRSVSLGFNIKVGWTRSENIVTTPRTKRFFDIELLPRHHPSQWWASTYFWHLGMEPEVKFTLCERFYY